MSYTLRQTITKKAGLCELSNKTKAYYYKKNVGSE